MTTPAARHRAEAAGAEASRAPSVRAPLMDLPDGIKVAGGTGGTGGAGGTGGTGGTVTATGPAETITGADRPARYRRTLPGRAYGSHDTTPARIRPRTVTGSRLARSEATR
ncbi:hypothetical protein AB0912_34975 [Streptomyces sp. NPDC007084]|uniref:hypothetical protein n=1 Tax=Streptomyces sp. NPDC007084 TaxID=3154313 RepID=UPI0034571163